MKNLLKTLILSEEFSHQQEKDIARSTKEYYLLFGLLSTVFGNFLLTTQTC